MPYKIPQSKVKARMLREVAAKHNQLTQLQQEHSSLLFQHSLLTATCELLRCIRAQHLPHTHADIDVWPLESSSKSSTAENSCSILLGDEQELLQQLQQLHCCSVTGAQHGRATSSCALSAAAASRTEAAGLQLNPEYTHGPLESSANAADLQLLSCSSSGSNASSSNAFQMPAQGAAYAALPAPEVQPVPGAAFAAVQQRLPSLYDTISPPDDALSFCRRLLLLPRPRGLTTLGQLQEEYATAVCELSLNLAMLEQPQLQASCCTEDPAAVIERLVCRHFHQLVSLVLENRNDLVMAFYLSNCLSGAVGEGMHKPALVHTVLQLQLTPEQQQRIADGEALFKRLLAPVIQARQQLQGVGFSSSSSSSSGHLLRSGSGSSSGSSGFAADATALIDDLEALDGFPARTSALQKEQNKVANLSTLMKKELLLKACLTSFTLGCITWAQAARLLVTTFPFPPPLAALSQEIAEQWQQRRESEAHNKKRHFQPVRISRHANKHS